jgi:3-hydroxy acid dehydrogenase/malonic semialdehyde reductase
MYKMLDPTTLTVFITGATSGYGEATARRYAEAGANVIATGRRWDRLVELQNELGPEHCHIAALDVRDKAAIDAVIADLPPTFANINVVVANAGLALGLEPAYETSLADWEEMIETNVKGLAYTVRALLPGMVRRKEGHVVTLGSVAADYPYPGGAAYGGTKSFVKQFALALRADLNGKNVRVTNIEPGMSETEFSLVRFKGDEGKAENVYAGMTPMTGADIAESIVFATTLPRHVNINRIQLMATAQSFSPFAVHREGKS